MTRKAEAPVQPRQALEVQLMKSVFDFNSWTEFRKAEPTVRSDKRKTESAGRCCLPSEGLWLTTRAPRRQSQTSDSRG